MVDEQLDDEVELDETEDEDEPAADDKEKAPYSPPRRQAPRPQQRSQRFPPSGGQGGQGNYRRPYRSRRKVCTFCVEGIKTIGWKDFERLRRFVNDGGGMRSRRKTGTCAKHQRRLAVAIKRARHLALLSYTVEHVRVMGKS
ncbi:MAG TPA: 30S ribosomal protein S18 [Anaerolineae bacterium]|jgi:small subunit ribosomal protein S18